MPHSLAQAGEFTCSECQQPFTADVWLIVDAQERPDLVQRIQAGDLHALICPRCACAQMVDAPLLLYQPHAGPAAGQPPLLFSPAERTTAEQDQEQGSALLSWLAQALGDAWQDAWLPQVATVPRRLLAAALSDDPQAALRQLQAEPAAQEAPPALDEDAAEAEPGRSGDEQAALEEGLRSLLQLLDQFVQARSWDESQHIVAAHPELLDEAAEAIFDAVIESAEQNGDAGSVQLLTEHRDLLRRCRQSGVARAFAEKLLPAEGLAEAERLGMAPEEFLAALRQAQDRPQIPPELKHDLRRARAAEQQYLRTGDLAALDAAVASCAAILGAPALAAAEQRLQLAVLNNAGRVLLRRHRARGGMQDLARAIECWQRAVAQTPAGSPDLPSILNNLGSGLRDRYSRTGQLADLAEALRVYERAVAETPAGSPDLPSRLNNLGTGLSDRYGRTGQLADLEEALRVYERAVAQTPAGSPDLPSILNNLGTGLRDRYGRTGQLADLEEALRSYRAACLQGASSAPNEVLNAARNWGSWALQRGEWAEAVEAYQQGLDTGRLLLARHWGRVQKGAWLRELQAMPAPLAYALARLGRLEEAVVAAERGRARLLAEALERTRRDLALLPGRGQAAVHTRYQVVVHQLNQLTGSDAAPAGGGGSLGGPARLAAIAAANAEFAAVVAAIRQVAGYENFLVEPGFAELAPQSLLQPVVYLLATGVGGLALILHAGTVQPLWLDELSAERLDALLLLREDDAVRGGYLVGQLGNDAELRRSLPPLLAALGKLIGQPLAAALRALPGGPVAVTLIPSGRLALLPLHAAFLEEGRTLQDAFAVRYAPSALSAAAAEQRTLPPGQPPLLALGNPRGAETQPALFTDWLAAGVAQRSSGATLLFEQAAATAFQAQLAGCAPAHLLFGCHGVFEVSAPLQSGLELADGRLTLARLLDDLRLDGVDLVTLCSCQTAITDFSDLPDEAIGLPAAFLQAGVRRVIGALWPVHVLPTVLLLDHFYAQLAAGVAVERALAASAAWLRTLPRSGAAALLAAVLAGAQDVPASIGLLCEGMVDAAPQPFAHPMYWAAFACTGAGAPPGTP